VVKGVVVVSPTAGGLIVVSSLVIDGDAVEIAETDSVVVSTVLAGVSVLNVTNDVVVLEIADISVVVVSAAGARVVVMSVVIRAVLDDVVIV